MRNILALALVMGAIAGLLVGGFLNVFNVPVMEWAIELEEAAAAADASAGEAAGIYASLGSLGAQRVGLVLGLAVLGVVYGAVFTGLFHVVRNAFPGWNVWAWALIAGFVGFWSVSLFTQIKFPLNPPGIGEEGSLLGRQGFQFLFILLSIASVVGAGLAVRRVHDWGWQGSQLLLGYAGTGVAYAAAALIIVFAIPGNPDPIPEWVPDALVILFRTFSIIGHLLLWMLIAVGVSGYIRYQEKGISAATASSTAEREIKSGSQR